jgi:excinuclease ABC subunit C
MNPQLKKRALSLPATPGVYLMKDRHGNIVYVGKAKQLKRRVSSYFIKNAQHPSKIIRMVHQLADFEAITTDTELDALLLECSLIQKYRPMYNRQMNAFEHYQYFSIQTTATSLFFEIKSTPNQEHCFGPYSIAHRLTYVKSILEAIYGLNHVDHWHTALSNKLLQPDAPIEIAQKEVLDAFRSQGTQPLLRLKTMMEQAAEHQAFERAQKLKQDWLFLTRFFKQNQHMIQAVASDWQMLWLPVEQKIKYYLIYQGLVLNTRLVTKRTFYKYTPVQLAEKIKPATAPAKIKQYSKEQIDFLAILYRYIHQHEAAHLINLY